jgi:hypothetical protein
MALPQCLPLAVASGSAAAAPPSVVNCVVPLCGDSPLIENT